MTRAAALYLLLALGLLLPGFLQAGLSPLDGALGHPQADTWNHTWGYHHTAAALAAGEAPWRVIGKGWPDGGALWFIDQGMALLLAPVTLSLGAVAAYNLGALLNLWLAGLSAWMLARHLRLGEAEARFVGAVWLAQPHLIGQLYDGISETLAVGWIALALRSMLRLAEEPDPARGREAGAVVGLALWFNPYYGLIAALIAAGVAAHALTTRTRRLRRGWRAWAGAAAWAGGIGGAFAALFSASLSAPDALVRRDPGFVYRTLVGHNMVDLLAFFHPGRFYSPDLKAMFDEDMVVVVYLGWGLIALAAAGAARARGWIAGAAVAWVLALGPFLYAGGQYLMLGQDRFIPLPFLALYDVVPALSRVSHPYRFVVVASLCLAVAAGRALGRLPDRWRGRAALAAATLCALEALLLSPAPWPVPVSDARPLPSTIWLAAQPAPGAVLDLPVSLAVLDRSRYDQEQAIHGRPIPYGLNDPTPPILAQNPLTRFLIRLERRSVRSAGAELPWLELESGRRLLAAQGLAFVRVHTERYPAGMDRPALEALTAVLGPGERIGEAVVFTVGR